MAGQGRPLNRVSAFPLIEYWYRALHEPYGIKLRVNDMRKAKAHLYKARADAADPALAALSIITSPYDPTAELWIMKTELAANPSEPSNV